MGGFSDFIFGSEDKNVKVQNGSDRQTKFHDQILRQLQQSMKQGGGQYNANQYYNNLLGNPEEAYDRFSQPYMQQFQEQILPEIAERFAGQGALSSSGFGQALGGAASGLQGQLAKLFSDLQGNAAQQQYGQYNKMGNQGLNYSPFSYQTQKGSQGMIGPLATAAATAFASQGIQSLFSQNSGFQGGPSNTQGGTLGSGGNFNPYLGMR